jgi:hypothetical protein
MVPGPTGTAAAAAVVASGAGAASSPQQYHEQLQQQQQQQQEDDVCEPPRQRSSTPTVTCRLPGPAHPSNQRDAYQRLRQLVYASEYIDPEYVLAKLEPVSQQ